MKQVAVILVNYKDYAERFLADCKDGLRKQKFSGKVKIYCIDNSSSSESLDYLKTNFPEAVIIPREDGNYCAALNAGIKAGMADGCEYFVSLNLDVSLDERWLQELVSTAENFPECGIVQSKILLFPRNEAEKLDPKINTLGNVFHYLGFGFTSFYNQPSSRFTETESVQIKGYASGCSILIKKEVFEKIGLFNEEFYMYHDDLEFCWRAKLAGFTILLAPQSLVYHKYEFSRSTKMVYFMERNRYLTLFEYYDWKTIAVFLPMLAIMEFGQLFFALKNNWLDKRFEMYRYFLTGSTWTLIQKARIHLSKIRKIKDCDIIKDFESQIKFQEVANPLLDKVANPIMAVYFHLAKKIIIW